MTTWPHDSSCRICAAVDEWLAQRKASRRPLRAAANRTGPDAENAPEVAPDGGPRSAGPVSGAQRASYSERPATRTADVSDLAGGLWGAAESRDEARRPSGSPAVGPLPPEATAASG